MIHADYNDVDAVEFNWTVLTDNTSFSSVFDDVIFHIRVISKLIASSWNRGFVLKQTSFWEDTSHVSSKEPNSFTGPLLGNLLLTTIICDSFSSCFSFLNCGALLGYQNPIAPCPLKTATGDSQPCMQGSYGAGELVRAHPIHSLLFLPRGINTSREADEKYWPL